MKITSTLRLISAALLAAAPLTSWTAFDPVNDDTDIFLANPAFSAARPNVLLFVDNTANWSADAGNVTYPKKFDAVKAGLLAFVGGVLTDEFNVGFATYSETGQPNGAYLRYSIRQQTSSNKTALSTTINNLTRTGDNTNNGAFSLAMAEMYSYYAGITAYTGSGNSKRDYKNNAASPGGLLPDSWAFTSAASTTYVSPIQDKCQKNFIILISNGPGSINADNTNAGTYLGNLKSPGSNAAPSTQFSLSPSGEEGDWSDEFADYMANADCNTALDGTQNVFTYAIDILPDTSKPSEVKHTALLQSIASHGKGKYFVVTDASTTDQFTGILTTIFKEVQAVNSVFASTTLPVSVNVRGTNLNQVYIGVFRPDAAKSPRWLGNLKLYKLGVIAATSTLFLADASGNAAENASTGFITGGAKSFWTASSTYWGFRDPSLNGQGGTSDSPDGDLVEKGGSAQQLRIAYPSSQSTRNLYTCVNAGLTGPCAVGASLSATPFNNTYVTAADVAAFTTYSVSSLTSASTTATLVLPTAPNPAWAVGDQIRIDGAAPSTYDVTKPVTSISADKLTYTYDLSAALDASTARVVATSHNLQTGDLVTVTGASPVEFNVTDATVDRRDPNVFRYPAAGVAGTATGGVITGKKLVTALTSPAGLAPTALATISAHGYGATNALVTLTFSGATPTTFNNSGAATTATVVDADTVSYTVVGTLSGGGTVARVSASSHGLTNGQSIFIGGVTNEATACASGGNCYNTSTSGTGTPITLINADAFTYTLGASGATANAATTMPTMYAGVKIKWITHANNSDTATVTLYTGHNWASGLNIVIQGTGGIAPTAYDAPFSAVGNPSGTVWSISNVNAAAGTFDITYSATAGNRLRNAPACLRGASGDAAPSGFTTATCPVQAGMIAGRPVSALVPVVSATGTIYAAKSITPVTSISALTTATGTITAGRTSDSNTTLRDQIIAWTRGADNKDEEDSATGTAGTDIRPSAHGDVLHSRPAVVNYSRYGDDNDIYAFYGSNDGVFHALKGGIAQHTTGADTALKPGSERWGFIPREFLGKLKRLRDQAPTISNINQKDYFADGSIGVYQKDVAGSGDASNPGTGTVTGVIGDNAGDKVYIYLTMRRGGDFIYALDVTNPATPKLLWRKSSADTADGWGELGMTWSEPRITRVNASLGNTSNPDNVVLIFGAGYDDALEDINPCLLSESTLTQVKQKNVGSGSVTYTSSGSCTITGGPSPATTTTISRTRGRGIFVVDAFSGVVIWQAGGALTTSSTGVTAPAKRTLKVDDMTCAIPSDTTVLDKNRNGFGDRIYVGDTCGQMWRADIASSNMDEWTVTKVASVSSSTATDIANKLKFLFPPDLVFGTDATGNYTAVLLGSGDREHPFDGIAVNRFYMFKDRDGPSGTPNVGATNDTSKKISGFASPGPTGSTLADSDVFDATNTALIDGSDAKGLKGWKITLATGEKVVSSATSVAGTVFFNTNQPSATAGGTSCNSNLGIAREYLVGFADAAATVDLNATGGLTIADRSTEHAGGGYLPSPVPVVVEIDGKKYQAVISGTSVQTPPGLTLEKRTRSYWYKEVD